MKLADIVTLGNLLGGFASVIALFLGSFDWACYLIYIAYVFDVLDGPVARLTGKGDEFGSVLDGVCDFVTNSIAASFIVFFAFWQYVGYPWYLAAGIAAFPFTFGTIRQARSMVEQLSYPCYWLGVPRPVLALSFLALINSTIFMNASGYFAVFVHAFAAVFIVVMSFLHLSRIPFVNHHKRRWMTGLHFGVYVFLLGTPLALLFGWLLLGRPRMVYDHLLFCFLVYYLISWMQISREDLRRIRLYLAGGPLIKPLVHVDSSWRSHSWADYFLAHKHNPPPEDPASEAPPAAEDPHPPTPSP